MKRVRRLCCACVIAAFVAGAGAGAVSAATFYVNERSGNDSNTCKGRAPTEVCLTIHAAVTKAEAVTGPNTIEVAEGEYKETKSIELAKTTDAGLTINGEEPGVRFSTNGIRAVTVGAAAGAITLSHLGIVTNGAAAVRDEGAELTLANDTIEDESGVNGVEAASHGSLTILNTEINMESGSTGFAVRAKETPLTLNGDTILEGSQSAAEAGGVTSEKSTLAMTNTTVDVETGLGPVLFGVAAGRDTSASLTNVAVRQNTSGPGVVLEKRLRTSAACESKCSTKAAPPLPCSTKAKRPGSAPRCRALPSAANGRGPACWPTASRSRSATAA